MQFKDKDHVIWENDTKPEVCVLKKDRGNKFRSCDDGEVITRDQLKYARLATHAEIRDYYTNKN